MKSSFKLITLLLILLCCAVSFGQTPPSAVSKPARPRLVSTKPDPPCSPRDWISAVDTGVKSVCKNDGSAWEDQAMAAGGVAGTVTSVSASGGTETTTGSAITSTGTIRAVEPVNAQASTASYAILDGDRGKLITFTRVPGSVAVSLAQAGTAGAFPAGWFCIVKKLSGGAAITITPAVSTINGEATLDLTTGQSAKIVSDGTNYTLEYLAGSGGISSLTPDTLTKANGAGDGVVDSQITDSGTDVVFGTFSSVVVSGAGTTAANGTYTPRGISGGKPYFNLEGHPNNPLSFSIVFAGGWFMYPATPDDGAYYAGDTATPLPWETTWQEADLGASPAPTVSEGTGGSTPDSVAILASKFMGASVSTESFSINGVTHAVGFTSAAKTTLNAATGVDVRGTNTSDEAPMGYVGEYLTASRASGDAFELTTATPTTITSVSLTAGDWDVWGIVDYVPAATTTTLVVFQGASLTNDTLGAVDTFTVLTGGNLAGTALGTLASPAPVQRFSLPSTTTVHLVGKANFAGSTMAAYGSIFARRVR